MPLMSLDPHLVIPRSVRCEECPKVARRVNRISNGIKIVEDTNHRRLVTKGDCNPPISILVQVERIIADNGIDPPLEVVKNYELDTHVVVLFGSRPF